MPGCDPSPSKGVLLDERILMQTLAAFPTTALTAPAAPTPWDMRRRVESRAVSLITTR